MSGNKYSSYEKKLTMKGSRWEGERGAEGVKEGRGKVGRWEEGKGR